MAVADGGERATGMLTVQLGVLAAEAFVGSGLRLVLRSGVLPTWPGTLLPGD
jgi:hypothetical protein